MTQNAINSDKPIEVAKGGTGNSTLTDHGVLVGSGTAAITPLAEGATNTVLQGTTTSDPAFTATPTVTSVNFGGTSLANYDEGTWTPSLTFGGGSTGMTYQAQVGRYTRIGDTIYCRFRIILTAKGSSTGNAAVSGLPFTSAAEGFQATIGRQQYIDLAAGDYFVTLENSGSSTTTTVMANGDNTAGTTLTHAAFADNSRLLINFWYHV